MRSPLNFPLANGAWHPDAQVEQQQGCESIEEILLVVEDVASGVSRPYLPHGELLFDEHGLPR